MVPPAEERAAVRGSEQGVHLDVAQERNDPTIEALGRDGEHPLDDPGVLGMAEGGEAEQGVHGCQPGVAGPHGVPPSLFEVVQERRDRRGVEVLERERFRSLLGFPFEEAEQEPEGVPIGADGVGARLALGHQPFGEECLECGGQRAHGRGSVACSRRSAASPSSSGAPDKYQYVLAGWTWPR